MRTPFKMKGISFGDSPMRQKKAVSIDQPPTNNPKYKPSNVRVAGPGTRKLSVEAAKKLAQIGKFVRGSSLVGAAYGLFKGYGNLAKTKHGKQIIKDSGVGRTRKI